MSWVTFVWAIVIGACVIMALPNLLAGLKGRRWEDLFFVLAALSVAAIACGELAMMHARTAVEIGRLHQWTHVPVFLLVVSIAGFVRAYFGTARLWLGVAACGTRLLSLIINFACPPNVNFREVTGLRQLDFLGETVVMPEGVVSAWTRVGEVSSLLMLAYVIDASIRLWRKKGEGNRRRAVVVGGSITLFILLAAGLSALIHARVLHVPYLISLPFLGVVLAMGFELSYDLVRAAQTAGQLRASEAALRESEMRVSLAASAADLGLWVWDVREDDLWMMEKRRELFGFGKSERISLNRFLQAVHEDDRARLQQELRDSLRTGKYESEYRIKGADGKTRWVAGYGRIELDRQGQPACLRGVTRDISKRRLAEEVMRTSGEINRTVLASLHNQIAILDRAGTIVAVNDAWKKFALMNRGTAASVSVGVNYLDVCRRSASAGDGTARLALEGVQSVLEGRSEFFEIEYPCDSPSEPRWFLARVVPLKTTEGGAVISHAEITRLKQVEESLRESDARFRTVANQAPVMIWMSGPNKEGIFFNKGWLEFTGRSVEQELGAGWLEGVHAEDLAHCLSVCGNAFSKREPFTVEYRLRRNDGEYRWLLDTGTPRFDPGGAFLGYIGSCIDIGERKQAEMDHQLQSMELARVGRLALMGELAASLAHEVNNPLGAMVTNASAGQRLLARDQLGPAALRELLADIISDGHRAKEVIDGIRNMVRKSEASRSPVEVKTVMNDLLRTVRADAIARNISFVAETDEHAGIVRADRVQLLQVLLNLTLNAFEALAVIRADARRVVVRAEPVRNGKICVTVRDTGPGFPSGIADQLFEPFFSTKAEGTGMGLAIARSIVEAHHGTLVAESCATGGALFTLSLPEVTEAKSRAV